MSAYIPYLVIVAVILVFFIVCYFVFRESPKKEVHHKSEANVNTVANSDYYKRRRGPSPSAANVTKKEHTVSPAVSSAEAKVSIGKAVADRDVTKANMTTPSTAMVTREVEHFEPTPTVSKETPTTVSSAVSNTPSVTKAVETAQNLADEKQKQIDMTQPMIKGWGHERDVDPVDNEVTRRIQRVEAPSEEKALDATRVMPRIDALTTVTPKPVAADGAEKVGLINDSEGVSDLIDFGTKHFIASFGILNDETKQLVRQITAEALDRLGITARDELKALLENIVVQEALFGMQKAYVTSPLPWMKETAIMAFMDVVQEPKSSTPYLLAFDALRILPHLHLGHFQIMALALLLQYSRNSNNYNLEHFRHYVEKYIEPFLSDLPREEFMYRQLDYLRCCAEEPERTTLGGIFSNSYPLVFNYEGFSREELERALQGTALEGRFVVKSLMSNRLKLAVADEGLLPRYFRTAGITDHDAQTRLHQLVLTRPIGFKKNEFLQVMETISPLLPKLADVYDSMPISSMSLTLLGLYLGKAHVKITIGEDFDLTPWY
ncbi:LPO_1073/Vpar_1526 family protein [uncultured Veillonella sp.]|uniref:LPO_1073/Vpar_1526 family protein n=1 Tax=uncultured Veillonella sp. TaxID=159268 RepID=UPI0025EAFCEA|nr:LPO_1073/Vpar_1526 family protein [uncultured Veillonella sp.]